MRERSLTEASMVRPRQFSDDEILDVARQCFIEHGPSVSTNLIADAAGVSQATLFKRFGTKHELMIKALTLNGKVEALQLMAQGPGPGELRAQLLHLAMTMTTMFDRMIPCLMTMWASGQCVADLFPEPEEAPPVLARRALTAFFAKAQEQGRMAPGDAESRAMAFIGAVKELAFQQHMFRRAQPRKDPAAYAEAVVDTFWRGCAPLEPA